MPKRRQGSGNDTGRTLDASRKTGGVPSSDIPPPPTGPKSIRETQAWRKSTNSASQLWSNYKFVLASSFKRMTRSEQEQLLTRASIIITIGVTVLALGIFYQFIPRLVRVFAVPGAVFAAWWLGTKVVSAVVISRFSHLLNKDN